MESHPSRGELLSAKTAFRQPRYNDKGEPDSPKDEFANGHLFVALGVAAVGFAGRSMTRVRKEFAIIQQMWSKNTTLYQLKEKARAGIPLPDIVLVKGTLTARGRPVSSVASKVAELKPLIGSIEQPSNFFLDLGAKVLSGEVKLPKGFDLEKVYKFDDVERVEDDFSSRQAILEKNLVVSELFVTRLGCEARKEVTKDKNGNRRERITRSPRRARFNVLHHRQVADGLELMDSYGDRAGIKLEDFGSAEMAANESPSLFLSLPDPLKEFKQFFRTTSMGKVMNIANADKPLSHLSKFLHLDQQSKTDTGAFSTRSSRAALDDLGRLFPHGWLWSGKGFYDNNPGSWSAYAGVETLDYIDFKRRMLQAAELNAKYQSATKMSTNSMRLARDEENCFRVSEIGIPNYSDVVVLGKPQLTLGNNADGNDLIIAPPDQPTSWANISDPRFNFRILKGHTIDNLMKHRTGAMQAYLGFGAMGIFTIDHGLDLIRDSLVVVG